MQSGTTHDKICVVCGQDCSKRPRTKDAKGRYYCRPCYERTAAAVARRRARAATVTDLEANPLGMMEELCALEPDPPRSCPQCKAHLFSNAVLCTNCGFDCRDGQVVQTGVRSEPTVPPPPPSRPVLDVLRSPVGPAAVVTTIFAVLLAMSFVTPRAAGAYLALDGIFGLIMTFVVLIAAFRESVLHGLGLLLGPIFVAFFAAGAYFSGFPPRVALIVSWVVVIIWGCYVLCVVYGVIGSYRVRWLFTAKILIALGSFAAVAAGAVSGPAPMAGSAAPTSAISLDALRSGALPARPDLPRAWSRGNGGPFAGVRTLQGKAAPALTVSQWFNAEPGGAPMRGKIVVVEFWSTLSRSCRDAIPMNIAIAEKYGDEGVAFIGLHAADRGVGLIPAAIDRYGIDYPVAVDDGGVSQEAWRVLALPTYVVLDRRGVVRAAGVRPDRVESEVRVLLREDPL